MCDDKIGIPYEDDEAEPLKCEECKSTSISDYQTKFIIKEIYIESFKCNTCGHLTENEKSI